jgi:hypothetical protein
LPLCLCTFMPLHHCTFAPLCLYPLHNHSGLIILRNRLIKH